MPVYQTLEAEMAERQAKIEQLKVRAKQLGIRERNYSKYQDESRQARREVQNQIREEKLALEALKPKRLDSEVIALNVAAELHDAAVIMIEDSEQNWAQGAQDFTHTAMKTGPLGGRHGSFGFTLVDINGFEHRMAVNVYDLGEPRLGTPPIDWPHDVY
jgi:phage protein D